MTTFSAAERSYDRMLAVGPPEPPSFDIPVTFEMQLRDGHLAEVTTHLGGHAFYASQAEDGFRLVRGETLVEEVENTLQAEDVVTSLITRHLAHLLDPDTMIISAEPAETQEPDWDAIAKDRRLEADGLL